jgi:hypothetical protein
VKTARESFCEGRKDPYPWISDPVFCHVILGLDPRISKQNGELHQSDDGSNVVFG